MTAVSQIFHYRTLLWFLTLREWKDQTRRTFLGYFWVIAYPFVLGAVVSVLFGGLVPSHGHSYASVVLCAMIPWQLFSQTLLSGCDLLPKHHEILRKVRFPTEVLFLAHILCRSAQFFISLGILSLFLYAWGYSLSTRVWQIFPWLLLQNFFAMGLLFMLAPASLVTRDIEHGLGLVVLLWFYATPILYPLSWLSKVLPTKLLPLYHANPMVGIVEGYRSALLGTPGPTCPGFITSEVAVIFLVGYFLYKKAEPYFAQNA